MERGQKTNQESLEQNFPWRRADMRQNQRFETNVTNVFGDIEVKSIQRIDTGSCIWDASIVLSSFLLNTSVFKEGYWKGKKVLEIGSGCGIPGIVASKIGASVTLTELNDEMDLLVQNVNANFDSASIGKENESTISDHGSIKYHEFFWGESAAHLEPPFDVILAADCVYELQLFHCLTKALVDISDENSVLYMCIEHRWKDVEGWFWESVNEHFTVSLIPQHMHGQYSHPKIDIYELKRIPSSVVQQET